MPNDITKPDTELKTITGKPHDFSEADLAKLHAYQEAGLPGISLITDDKIKRIMELYLTGKTYHQISRITGIKRDPIMYLSKKFDWYAIKQEYLFELNEHMANRIIEAKITSQDFLLHLKHMWETKISKKIDKYLSSGNEIIADEIDGKVIDRYLKIVDTLVKLNDLRPGSANDRPTVGLNLGDGVTVKKIGNDEVEITPKSTALNEMLKKYADFNRKNDNDQKNKNTNKDNKEGDGSNETT
jgi:hypothetical protein